MPNPLDRVPVLYQDLESIVRALRAAENYHAARDIAKAAESMNSTSRQSPLTVALGREVSRVNGYLEQETEDEPE
jgi:hypothetical protein